MRTQHITHPRGYSIDRTPQPRSQSNDTPKPRKVSRKKR